MKSWQWLALS
jgi:hypothetical protein